MYIVLYFVYKASRSCLPTFCAIPTFHIHLLVPSLSVLSIESSWRVCGYIWQHSCMYIGVPVDYTHCSVLWFKSSLVPRLSLFHVHAQYDLWPCRNSGGNAWEILACECQMWHQVFRKVDTFFWKTLPNTLHARDTTLGDLVLRGAASVDCPSEGNPPGLCCGPGHLYGPTNYYLPFYEVLCIMVLVTGIISLWA